MRRVIVVGDRLLAVRRAARLRAGRLPAAARGARPAAPRAPAAAPPPDELPTVSLIVAAYDEGAVIGRKVANALALDYPRERLEIVVASDGSTDGTVLEARRAGADLVLDLERGGKIRAQDAAVARSTRRDRRVLGRQQHVGARRAARARRRVRRREGRLRLRPGALRQRRRHEPGGPVLALRDGAARARVAAAARSPAATARSTRRAARPTSRSTRSWATTSRFPFNMVKRGWRAVYVPQARATEKMVPSIEGEFARKRRMMSHAWPIVLRGGLLSPRGYPPLYALMIASHRVLRYARAVPARRRARGELRARRFEHGSTPSRWRCSSRSSWPRCSAASCRCARCSSSATTS